MSVYNVCFFFFFFAVLRIRDEETVLEKHFGSAWDRYKATRWRVIPLLW